MLMTTWKLVTLRFFNLTMGRFNFCAKLLKSLLIRILIKDKSEKYMASARFFGWDDLAIDEFVETDESIEDESEEWNHYWTFDSTIKRRITELVRRVYFARIFARIVKKLCSEGKVLEAGCGSGKILNYLARKGRYLTIGCDSSFAATRIARRNCDFTLVCDINHLPFKDDTFHLIFNQGVMEHFEEEEFKNIIRECSRASKRVLIIVPSKTSIFRIHNPFEELGTVFFSKPKLSSLLKTVFPRTEVHYSFLSFLLSVAGYGER